jgi:phosphoribosylglycinamide formyltransferase 1
MKNIAIFASGGGSNALKIIEHFHESTDIKVALIVSNQSNAGVLSIATAYGIPFLVIEKTYFHNSQTFLEDLKSVDIQYIVLAGFLLLVPNYLVTSFPIINIHPALLPKYGGKGMYGRYVHEAVKTAGETQSGITIHAVNERYDEGQILFQTTCELLPEDTAFDIAQKVLALEHTHFPSVIEQWVRGQI